MLLHRRYKDLFLTLLLFEESLRIDDLKPSLLSALALQLLL